MPTQYFQQLYSEFEAVRGSQRDLSSGRLSDPVAYVIRKAILSGVLKPGTSIPERVLAQELNVSRTPVREALFVLQGEGLVHLRHNRSALVAHFSQDDLHRVYALRGLLEGFSAECAAANPDRSHIPKVDHALQRYLKLSEQATPIEQAQADLEFHESILDAAGSQLLYTITRQVLAVTITHRSRYAYTPEQLHEAQIQHESIYSAIAKGDYALAKWLMTNHVEKSSAWASLHLSDSDPLASDVKMPKTRTRKPRAQLEPS